MILTKSKLNKKEESWVTHRLRGTFQHCQSSVANMLTQRKELSKNLAAFIDALCSLLTNA